MSKQDRLITNDETTGQSAGPGAQTSNKAGLHSDAVKPSNAGPDPHEEHKASVPGAFGNDETRENDSNDSPLGDWVPADKAHKH